MHTHSKVRASIVQLLLANGIKKSPLRVFNAQCQKGTPGPPAPGGVCDEQYFQPNPGHGLCGCLLHADLVIVMVIAIIITRLIDFIAIF